MLGLLKKWAGNVKYYSNVERKRKNDREHWTVYVDHNTAPLYGSLSCLNQGILRYRTFQAACILLNIIPLFMLASTYVVLTPELDWKCTVERHTGITPICRSHMDKNNKISSVCMMELEVDFTWNFTFTASPILEFQAFCPVQRSVEPKLVNFLGSFCGSLVGGIFMDTLGRKNMSLICAFFSLMTTLSYKVSSNMIMYTYQEFIKGVFSSIAALSLLTWCVEVSLPRYSSLVVALFFLASSTGQLLTTGLAFYLDQWRTLVVTIAAIGIGLIPLLFLVPSSLRYMIARGKTKHLPPNVNFREGIIVGSRAKDCLARPQTNRLYAINAVFLILLGFASHLLGEAIKVQHVQRLGMFQRAALIQTIVLVGHVVAVFIAFLPTLMYIINVFMILVAGILAIVATSTNYSDNILSLDRVLTGTSLMLIGQSVVVAFTTMKQIPTLNRGFYVASLNASYMLGSLIFIIVQSWCLEKENEDRAFCGTSSEEDVRLLVAGIILLAAVAFAFVNTCLSLNVYLPHSYEELQNVELTRGEEEQEQEELSKENITNHIVRDNNADTDTNV